MLEYAGLAGIPLIRAVVKQIGFVNGLLNVVLSLIIGVILNLAVACYLGTPLINGIALGVISGFGSNLYNDFRESVEK